MAKYSIVKIDSNRKRHVRPKEFPSELSSVGTSTGDVTVSFTLCDPRGKTGEGQRLSMSFSSADANGVLMAVLCGRIVGMMDETAYAQFDARLRETIAEREGQCTSQLGAYDCVLPRGHKEISHSWR